MDAITVAEDVVCASPNDVPGFNKEAYMNGRPCIDADGNRYRLGHGLSYR